MADRYWVGGTASWDSTAGTKWSSTSGGAGGASVPTAADDVFFDANSGASVVTIATGNTGARSINCTGFIGTITGTANIVVSGSVTLVAGMTYSYTGTITFNASATITSAGKTFGSIIVNGTGITVGLADAMSMTLGGLTVSVGTFNTNNFNLTSNSLTSSNSNTRTINLGSSTVTLIATGTSINFQTATNLTFNAGTSQINMTTVNSEILAGGALTFYNASFTSTGGGTRSLRGGGTNTFNNLTVAASTSAGITVLSLDANQTINGTLSFTGTAGNIRGFIVSNTYGLQRTLTVNGSVSLSDVDFRDIIALGSATPLTGTRIGNRGQNSGITFSAPKTVYWNFVSGGNWSSNSWALTSGGSVSTDNFPLPQDTVIIENTGLNTNATITLDSAVPFMGTINMSGRTNNMTINLQTNYDVYGSWTNGSGTTVNGTSRITFAGQGNKTITTAGKITQIAFTVSCIGGSLSLGDAYNSTGTSPNMTVDDGTFDTAGYSFRVRQFSTSGTTRYRRVLFRNSAVSVFNGQSPLTLSGNPNLFFDAGTSTLTIEGTNGSGNPHITAAGLTLYDVIVRLVFNTRDTQPNFPCNFSSFTARNLTFQTLSPTDGVAEVRLGGNITVTDTLTVPSNTVARRIFFRSTVVGTQRTLTVNNWVGTQNLDFMDINLQGSVGVLSGTSIGDCGRNVNINFSSPKTVYWNLAGTQNWSANGWALTSGGTPSTDNFPLPQDTIIFDNAGSAGTIAINGYYNIGNINGASRTTAITITHNTGTMIPKFIGDFIVSSAFTFSNSSPQFRFNPPTLKTLSLNGATLGMSIELQGGSTGGYTLGSAFTSTQPVYHFGGIFNCDIYNFTALNFQAQQATEGSTTLTKQLLMGSGLWTITGNDLINPYNSTFAIDSGSITNFSAADIIFTSTSTAGRSIGLGTDYYWKKVTIAGNGNRTNTLSAGNFTQCFVEELASTTSVAHTISLGGNSVWYIGKWSVTGTVGNVVTINRGGIGGSIFIVGPAVTGVDYLSFTNGMSLNSASLGEFYAGANSTNPGAGTGITFTAAPSPRTLYWVGGTGNWGDTARWSTSSNGAGGAALPTSLDDVIFDSGSNATAYTATINVEARCKSLTISGPASGNVTLAGSSRLNVYSGLTFPATGFTRTWSGELRLSGYNSNNVINTSGVNIQNNTEIFGYNTTWTMGSAIQFNGNLTISAGNFATNNFNLTYFQLRSNNLLKRSISLGSSTVVGTGNGDFFNFSNAMNLTFDSGTANISTTASSLTITAAVTTGNPIVFNDLTFSNTVISSLTFNGNITANNITITGRTSTGVATLQLGGNLTVNNTLTITAGQNQAFRTIVRSNTLGIQRTITCNAVAALSFVDFRDIAFAGNCISGGNITGTNLGDCKGNSNINFPAGKTVYWASLSSGNYGDGQWSLSSDGSSPGFSNFPLPQDTVIFPSNRPGTGQTLTFNHAYNIGTIDFSNRTSSTMTFSNANVTNIHGDFIAGSGVTFSGAASVIFCGRNTQLFTNAGRTYPFTIEVNSPGGTVTLTDALTASIGNANALRLTQGTFNDGGYNVNITATNSGVNLAGTDIRTVVLNGVWTLNGSSSAWSLSGTGITVSGNGTINLTNPSSKQFSGGDISYSGIILNQGGAGSLTITGNNSFGSITSTIAATSATTIALGSTSQLVSNFTASGQLSRVLTITGTGSNLIYTGNSTINLDYLNVQGRVYGAAGEITGVWYAGNNSLNSGSLGWNFTAAPSAEASNSNFFLLFA